MKHECGKLKKGTPPNKLSYFGPGSSFLCEAGCERLPRVGSRDITGSASFFIITIILCNSVARESILQIFSTDMKDEQGKPQ